MYFLRKFFLYFFEWLFSLHFSRDRTLKKNKQKSKLILQKTKKGERMQKERKKERKLLQFGVIHTNVLHACRKGERERKGRKRRHRTVVERVFYFQSFDEFLKRSSTGKKPRKQDVESVSSARKRTRTARFNEPTKKRGSNHGIAEYEYE